MTKAGIYRITNKINNKLYIGQSVDIEKRLKEHIYGLTKFKHPNTYLQNSVNKYNLESFVFETLETIEPFTLGDEKAIELLNYLEMFYIESYESLIYQNGYNIQNGGNNCSGYFLPNTIQYTFYNPDNEEVFITNLAKYCKEHNLNVSGMRRVAYEETKSYKKWTKYKKIYSTPTIEEPPYCTYKYTLKSPSGINYNFNCLKDFALEHNLSYQLLSHVITGKRKHHKYWTLPDINLDFIDVKTNSCPVNQYVKYNWVNITTKETVFCTVSELSKKYQLESKALYMIPYPNNNITHYKNWTLLDIKTIKVKPKPNKPTYKFVHKEYGVFEGTTDELLCKYSNLISCKVNCIVNKTRKTHGGWSLYIN